MLSSSCVTVESAFVLWHVLLHFCIFAGCRRERRRTVRRVLSTLDWKQNGRRWEVHLTRFESARYATEKDREESLWNCIQYFFALRIRLVESIVLGLTNRRAIVDSQMGESRCSKFNLVVLVLLFTIHKLITASTDTACCLPICSL